MKNRGLVIAAALLLSLSAAVAGPRDLLVFYPGAPGSPEDAASVMAEFGECLAKAAGWPAGALKVSFENDLQLGLGAIQRDKPGFALVGLPVYLAQAGKLKLKLVAQSLPAGGKTDGYYLLGRKADGPANLNAAKGLKLISNLLYDKTFVSRIVLGGMDLEKNFKLKEVSSGLRAIKQVVSEEKKADLVLLDQHQHDSLGTLDEAKLLKQVHRSPDLPTAPVVAFDGVASDADIAALKKALLGMGADKSAEALCETMTLKGFAEPDAAAYEAARKLYGE
ncbi:MAG: PhnD/SsuA/transferrin family substrate-binding protein [Verrucomicrobia bacterium]|nr:PhnD/SsuA/transferrin family substrate-binding protein [Verrucomicrobiota bacterium]